MAIERGVIALQCDDSVGPLSFEECVPATRLDLEPCDGQSERSAGKAAVRAFVYKFHPARGGCTGLDLRAAVRQRRRPGKCGFRPTARIRHPELLETGFGREVETRTDFDRRLERRRIGVVSNGVPL